MWGECRPPRIVAPHIIRGEGSLWTELEASQSVPCHPSPILRTSLSSFLAWWGWQVRTFMSSLLPWPNELPGPLHGTFSQGFSGHLTDPHTCPHSVYLNHFLRNTYSHPFPLLNLNLTPSNGTVVWFFLSGPAHHLSLNTYLCDICILFVSYTRPDLKFTWWHTLPSAFCTMSCHIEGVLDICWVIRFSWAL